MKYKPFLFFLFPFALFAQSAYRSPVDFPIGLSGTFGEPRTNHFHSGIDIRTQQAVGKKVYAVADGYISRISVSPSGFGKALYITHYDGNTSVYGHLLSFNETITKYVTAEQYKNETFALNLTLEPEQMPVKKGEVVALSGNTAVRRVRTSISKSATPKPKNRSTRRHSDLKSKTKHLQRSKNSASSPNLPKRP